eukprot:6595692-Pyramimonas_sp.AAC.1
MIPRRRLPSNDSRIRRVSLVSSIGKVPVRLLRLKVNAVSKDRAANSDGMVPVRSLSDSVKC